jgi:hypothetical protein
MSRQANEAERRLTYLKNFQIGHKRNAHIVRLTVRASIHGIGDEYRKPWTCLVSRSPMT